MNIIKRGIFFLFVFSFFQPGYAQNVSSKVTVHGKITDSKTGENLIGASVFIKGTPTGTASDTQ
jgi:hypothetical protein